MRIENKNEVNLLILKVLVLKLKLMLTLILFLLENFLYKNLAGIYHNIIQIKP